MYDLDNHFRIWKHKYLHQIKCIFDSFPVNWIFKRILWYSQKFISFGKFVVVYPTTEQDGHTKEDNYELQDDDNKRKMFQKKRKDNRGDNHHWKSIIFKKFFIIFP